MPRAALSVALALAFAPAALAGTLEGVTLPDDTTVGDRKLVLNGMGLREATILMVNVYVAGLYVPQKSSDPQTLLEEDVPKRIVLRFVRGVSREKLVEAWSEGFAKNAGGKKDAVAPGLDRLSAAMRDVKKGETVALTYVPDSGTTVTIGDRDVATIPGADFARVLFAVWLGPAPPNVGLREGLLGRAPS